MPRAARPSDIYRLPEHARPTESSSPPPEPPPRRFPVWVGVAGVVAAALIISGLVRGATGAAPGDVPLVDVVSEDQAIAALRLYGAQAATINELRERTDIYANPGPRDAAQVAQRGSDEVRQALRAARRVPNPDPLVRAYIESEAQVSVASGIANAASLADVIALLASVHDTLYSGNGAISMDEAYTRVSGLLAGGGVAEPVAQWATALLEQMEDRNRVQAAADGRARTQQLWQNTVESLEPAAVAELQTYLTGLPAVTVDGLRGHPVAGPALKLLEEHSRQVSRDG